MLKKNDMTRRDFLKSLGLGTAAITLPSLFFRCARPGRPPNVLFIAVDDLNDWANCLGGYPGVHTPNLDRLAGKGVLFTNAHCSAPACNPSRASIMTGIRPSTSGVYINAASWRDSPALEHAVTIPEHFRNLGYRVVGGGKIFHALSWIWERYGKDRNDPRCWDDYFPSMDRQMPDAYWPNPDARIEDGEVIASPMATGTSGERPPWFFDWAPVDVPDERMSDHKVVNWALNEFEKEHDRPFFQAVGIFKPHIPWYVPRKYFEMYPLKNITLPNTRPDWMQNTPPPGREIGAERRAWHEWILQNDEWKKAVQGYLAGISFSDAMLGRLLDGLESSPAAENTIIVLWSDHGFHLGERQTWEKFTLWEESTRVALMVVAPGVTRPGGVCSRPVSLLDVYPTLVELSGAPARPELEGVSLVPLLKNPQALWERSVVTTWLNHHAVRSERFRYIRYDDGSEELYDHDNDPAEFENLADNPEYDSIKQDLARWLPDVKIPYGEK